MSKYSFLQKLVKIATKIYIHPKYEGLENIPKDGAFIFAGTHIYFVDPGPIMSVTDRCVHFLAKASLFKFPQSLIFNNLGLIRVYRNGKDTDAYKDAIEYLKKGEIIGIYPEGTRERGRGLLPFKNGVIRMSLEANVPIIPFATVGELKPFRKGPTIRFGKPYKAKKDIQASNEELRAIIQELMDK